MSIKWGEQPITKLIVRQAKDTGGSKGYWDERTGEIVINSEQPLAAKYAVLLHEFMHVVETHLKQHGFIYKRINHDYITYSSAILIQLMLGAGMIKGITLEEYMEWAGSEENDIKPD